MDSEPAPPQLSPEALSVFTEGISLLLSRWTSLQMAVQNEWGGRDSLQKSEKLAIDLFSWFSKSKDPLYIDDLENMLDDAMMLSFKAEIEDGSIEEVAEQLMVMHEDCLQGKYESVEKLRKSGSVAEAVSQSTQLVNTNDEDNESSDEESSDMEMDESEPDLDPKPESMSVDLQRPTETMQAEDGWTVVGSRQNKGLVPGDFKHVVGDAHVYKTHIRPLQEQLQKHPKPFPILKINPQKKDIDSFVATDLKLIGYDPHQKIDMKMAV